MGHTIMLSSTRLFASALILLLLSPTVQATGEKFQKMLTKWRESYNNGKTPLEIDGFIAVIDDGGDKCWKSGNFCGTLYQFSEKRTCPGTGSDYDVYFDPKTQKFKAHRRRLFGWKPSHDISRRREGFHHTYGQHLADHD